MLIVQPTRCLLLAQTRRSPRGVMISAFAPTADGKPVVRWPLKDVASFWRQGAVKAAPEANREKQARARLAAKAECGASSLASARRTDAPEQPQADDWWKGVFR